jgi:hypothetical protein
MAGPTVGYSTMGRINCIKPDQWREYFMAQRKSKVSDAWGKLDKSLADELSAKILETTVLSPDEVTTRILSQQTGREVWRCYKFVENEVRLGRLIRTNRKVGGSLVYKRVSK